MHKKCYDILNLQKYENRLFIYERKSINKENIYSYKAVLQEVTKCLEYFTNYKVKNHVGIAIDLKEHSATNCILLLGILNHQCHFYCLDFEETADVHTYLRASGVKYVISSQDFTFHSMSKVTTNSLTVLHKNFFLYLLDDSYGYLENAKLCYTIATSGSTGLPKMVHVPYECLEPNIKSLSHLLKIEEDMIFLSSPPTFDPFVVEFFISLENGISILITSKEIRLQPQQLLKIMFPEVSQKRAVSIYQTTPSLFRLFGKQSIQDVILSNKSSLRCLILGGEEFPSKSELNSWLPLDFHTTDKRIFNIYGITEVSCWASIHEFQAKTNFVGENRVPLGKPLDNLTLFRVINESGAVLPLKACKGELQIGGSIRCCFIPQLDTDIKILGSNEIIYRKTGDLVEGDATGNLYYIGRTNNLVKRLGKRLCLDSLSKKIENLLNVHKISSKVLPLWHKEFSTVIFYFVNSEGIPANEREYIRNVLKENLESHEQPDKIFYGNELPINRHGKVDRQKLLQQILLPTNTPVQIFKDFLTNVMGFQLDECRTEGNAALNTNKRIKLCRNLSFNEAGGTSFQALSLATEIAQQLDECVQQRKLLEMLLDNNVTIADILTFLINCSTKFQMEGNSYKSWRLKTGYNLKLSWRVDLEKCIDAAPSIYKEQYLAVGSHSHLIVTVNATTGDEISRIKLNHRIECPVVFVNKQLAMVGCYDGFLYGFDFIKRNILWQLNARGMIKAKPLIIKGMIIVASYGENHNIFAYDLKSLAPIWCLKLGSKGIFSSPIQITQENVLFCGLDGTYAVIDIITGSIKWCQKLQTPIFSTATKIQIGSEIIVALAEVSGKIWICKAENGERINSFQAEGNIFSGLTLHCPDNVNDHTFVIFGCHDKNVYSLKLDHTTKQLSLFRKFNLNSAVYSTPIVISQRYILTCSTKGWIVVLNLHDCTLLASYDLQAEVFASPSCLGNEYFYVGARDNYLYAFQLGK